MHKVWLIAQREYLERVRTRAFLISTILIPVMMGAFVFGSFYLDKKSATTPQHVALVSADAPFALDLQQMLDADREAHILSDVISPPGPDTRPTLEHMLDDHGLDGYLWIDRLPSGELQFVYTPATSSPTVNGPVLAVLSTNVRTLLLRRGLIARGLGEGDVDGLTQPVRIDHGHHRPRSSLGAAFALFFLMYMVVVLYGMNVARSIIEEKTSRVFEVLLSTIRPEEMMAGKILGVGSVGLTQVGIWMLAVAALAATPFAHAAASGDMALTIGPAQVVFFVLYFIFGFLLYSSMAAALGAMTNSEQELQQLNMFLVMPLGFCMLMIPVVMNAPNSFWSRVVSLIPFCSPLLMNFRVSLSMPQPWEIGLSFVLMAVTILIVIWLASRIYRVGVLMYGKRPTVHEIMRWVKYS
ncbi:MAG: ABC transporter permease [Acidobacteriota bacterium]|nr:ABC transporter permease [Acidobacteriota bacterium]